MKAKLTTFLSSVLMDRINEVLTVVLIFGTAFTGIVLKYVIIPLI